MAEESKNGSINDQAEPLKSSAALFEGLTAVDSGVPPDATVPASEEPVAVVSLDGSRDSTGDWVLSVPAMTDAAGAQKWLKKLRSEGQVQLPDDLIERIAKSAVYPADIEGQRPRRVRTEHGWIAILDTLLFTPLVNVSVANDRWVADAVYRADPKFNGKGNVVALPMPDSDEEHAFLRYTAPTVDLLSAAEQNYQRILQNNPQDVGRRLIEQPVTLVVTAFGTSGAGDATVELAAVDGNSRISSAFAKLKIQIDWIPSRIRNSYRSGSTDQGQPLAPALLSNLTLRERRDIAKDLASHAAARLAQPAKGPESRGYSRDLAERNRSAETLNTLTVPAQIVVGFIDDDAEQYGMSRFASAVRALLMRMNVEVRPLELSARNAIEAEEIVLALMEEGCIDQSTYTVAVGRDEVAEAMTALGLDPGVPDLRATFVIKVLCGTTRPMLVILREKLRKRQIRVADRSRPAVELALRSYTASLASDDFHKARTALETGAIWSDLVKLDWEVVNIVSDEEVDLLALYARDQRESGGPLLRLLGVLGMFALVTTGNLNAARGSAEALVGGQSIDRGPVSAIVEKILHHDWGITLLADAIKRARSGERKMRWVDPLNPSVPIDAPEEWRGSDFDANLRLAANQQSVHEAVIPGSTQERQAWTAVSSAVTTAKTKLMDFLDLRDDNGTLEKLPWSEVEPTVIDLESMPPNIRSVSDPPPLAR